MTTRYWKYVYTDEVGGFRIFRETSDPFSFRQWNLVWESASNWYERVKTDPSYVEITETEALAIIAPFIERAKAKHN